MEAKDKVKIQIIDILKTSPDGLTITDLIKKTGLARHTVLTRLHELLGKEDVEMRQINMAKLHYWKKKEGNKTEETIKLVPLEEKHLTIGKAAGKSKISPKTKQLDFKKLKEQIDSELKGGKINKAEAQVKEQREEIKHVMETAEHRERRVGKGGVKTGIPGLDELLTSGIPKGSSLLLAGGAGVGKTILALQIIARHAEKGEKCLYMSFEESENRLMEHMNNFGWKPEELIKKKNILIKRFNPFDITRSVDALLMKAKGELLIDVDPLILPENYKPDIIIVDSLTAIASAFTGKEESYRIYIEQLFRFFEKIGATSFLITETKQIPTIFSPTGTEEFLADGVIVLYNIKRGNVREKAIEILKLRGAEHQKKIVAFEITEEGIVVYPEQEIFGDIIAEDEK